MTDEEVDGFNEAINISELLAYRELVGARTQEIIRGIKPEVLVKVIDDDLVRRTRDEGAFGKNAEWVPQRWEGKNKAFTLTWTVVGHSISSFGECYVIRSLLGLPNI